MHLHDQLFKQFGFLFYILEAVIVYLMFQFHR